MWEFCGWAPRDLASLIHQCPWRVLLPAGCLPRVGVGWDRCARAPTRHLTKSDTRHHPSCVFLIGEGFHHFCLSGVLFPKLVLWYSFVGKEIRPRIPVAPRVEPRGIVSIVPLGYQEGFSFTGKKTSSFGKAWDGPALNLPCEPRCSELQLWLYSADSVKMAEGTRAGGFQRCSAWFVSWIPGS